METTKDQMELLIVSNISYETSRYISIRNHIMSINMEQGVINYLLSKNDLDFDSENNKTEEVQEIINKLEDNNLEHVLIKKDIKQ